MHRRSFLLAGGVFAGAQLLVSPALASEDPVYQSLFGTAIDGTDPLSYFDEGRPIKGSKDFTHKWNGATWRFASAKNRDRFAAAPEKYAPQYGGYCAWAVANNYTASTNPNAWSIVRGKLYLNYSKSVQKMWEKNIPGHIVSGDRNWPGVLK